MEAYNLNGPLTGKQLSDTILTHKTTGVYPGHRQAKATMWPAPLLSIRHNFLAALIADPKCCSPARAGSTRTGISHRLGLFNESGSRNDDGRENQDCRSGI